jgi:glycine/D-amino acid oxidase-like deaminating enzyme
LLPQNMAVCDQRVALDYYRLSADRRLLFGGACHYSGSRPGHRRLHAAEDARRVPATGRREDRLSMGRHDRHRRQPLPQIGRLNDQPNVYYAQAYSGHG